jgi:hypothetical protein
MKILHFFLFFWVIFALLDPDPASQINADPCGSGYGSATLPGPLDDQAAQRQVAAQHRRHQAGLVGGLQAALLPGLEKTRFF